MRRRTLIWPACLLVGGLVLSALLAPAPASAQVPDKDYLSSVEADKIREALDPAVRIRLFVTFASDRLKQLQYELDHPENTLRRSQRLNGLLNAYTGCLDEAVDRIELGVEKQQDVRAGIQEMQTRAPEFLAYLKELAARGPERNLYRATLEDAIAATNDAIRVAGDAAQENAPAPPPVRRPQ